MIPTDLSASSAPAPYDVGMVLLVFVGVVLFAAAVRLLVLRLQAGVGAEPERELPPLVYPARAAGQSHRPVAARRPVAEQRPAPGDDVTFSSSAPAVRILRDRVNGPAPSVPTVDGNGAAGAPPVLDPDATLQLLPGRLEPVNPGTDQEIRFVKTAGVKRFTLGRRTGPSHSHIQLRSATASRMHAYMEFERGRWQLGNLSSTNSVVVNGSPLAGDATRVLHDGDRIEFGELTFVFRER